jgi:methionyl-tRNA formyltransferase
MLKRGLNVVFFGTPQFAVPSLQALMRDDRFTVVAVVTQPDRRRGRGNDVVPSPVKAAAGEIPVIQPDRIKKNPDALAQLKSYNADFFVVVAYGQLLSQEILDMPTYGCINGHGSLLPQYRGAAPIQWCLVNGETQTGMTTMLMDIGMDTGAMLKKTTLEIELLDNAHDLSTKLSTMSAELILETLPPLAAGSLTPEPQDNDRATYAPLIKKEDYVLDWSQSAIALHNKVRGFYPSCTTQFRNTTLKVIATIPLIPGIPDEYQSLLQQVETIEAQAPGTIAALVKNVGAIVQTGDGYLLLKEVQSAGKKAQPGWDFANGGRVAIGERVG